MPDENNQMQDMTEIALALDIATRMAIYSMAKLCDKEEIEEVMEAFKLVVKLGYQDQGKVDKMFELYTESTVQMSKAIDAIRVQGVPEDG